jgi:hypothetical protein
MGVDVVLMRVSQAGTSSRRRRLSQLDVVADPDEVFVRICVRSSLPMLRRVDPYGDLVLTAVEMLREVGEDFVPNRAGNPPQPGVHSSGDEDYLSGGGAVFEGLVGGGCLGQREGGGEGLPAAGDGFLQGR